MSDQTVSLADATWKSVFHHGPYTSMKIVDYMCHKAHVDYNTLVSNPKAIRTVSRQSIEQDDMNNGELYQTWASRTGRCTSFAIKVATLLEKQYPNTFKFDFYDLRGHRVARCRKTAVLIDSSSIHGAFRLSEGEWRSFDGSDARWKWIKGKSKFERKSGSGVKVSSQVISAQQGMSLCLTEVAKNTAILCLFRFIRDDRAKYLGLLNWNLSKKRLELVPHIDDKGYRILIEWGHNGSSQDNAYCSSQAINFVATYGRQEQWAADGIYQVHSRIWDAATDLWGYPVYIQERA